MSVFGIEFERMPLGYDQERTLMVSRPGRWALMVILPRIIFYRKRVHPSQRHRSGPVPYDPNDPSWRMDVTDEEWEAFEKAMADG